VILMLFFGRLDAIISLSLRSRELPRGGTLTKRIATINLVAFMMIPLTAKASLITGVLNITGTANLSTGSIAFGTGNVFSINSPASAQQGGFMALAGTTGTIADIANPPDATGPLDILDFMTFSAAPNLTITLTFLDPGIDAAAGCSASPAAAGQLCTPTGSPLDFQNTSASTATATFIISGLEVDSTTSATVPIDGVFTMPLNESFQQLLATMGSGGTVTTSFSASLETESSPPPSVPEPTTWTFISIGAAGMFLLRLIRLRA
jgi:hypothetical protein